jgi:hypothetical protein
MKKSFMYWIRYIKFKHKIDRINELKSKVKIYGKEEPRHRTMAAGATTKGI